MFDTPRTDDRYAPTRLADFERILGGAGVTASPATLRRAYEASGAFLARVWRDHRDVAVGEHVRALLAAIDPALPGRLPPEVFGELIDAYTRPALLAPPRPDEGALDALQVLRARGYTLAVVSNTMRTPGAILRQLLDRQGLLGCFDALTFSDEVGVRKPDPRIFALTLAAVRGEPATALHVGDDPVLDVQGARAAGMRVIQVTHAWPAAVAPRPDHVIPSLAQLPETVALLDA